MRDSHEQSIILLGASNLRLGLSAVLRNAGGVFDQPVNAFVACGFGRSYGQWSWIPFRGLPGIAECALWGALDTASDPAIETQEAPADPLLSASTSFAVRTDLLPHADGTEGIASREPATSLQVADRERPDLPLFAPVDEPLAALRPLALITDVGNDLLYDVPVSRILEWVESCLARLAARSASIVLTLPPVERLLKLSALRYCAARTFFFPSSRLTRPKMFEQVETLSSELATLGRRYSAAVVTPRLDWYGFDPIHIRRSRRSRAWLEICQAWPEFRHAHEKQLRAGRIGRIVRPPIWRLRPHHRRALFGEQFRWQPAFESEWMSLLLY